MQRLMNVIRDEEKGDTFRERFTVIHTTMSKRKVSKLGKLLDYHAMNHSRRAGRIARARIAYADRFSCGELCLRNTVYHVQLSLLACISYYKSRHSPWNGT